ncbi:hypothetical protein AB0903_12250 [Streptomyces sp. NPDC048389]
MTSEKAVSPQVGLADYGSREGPVSEQARQRARQVFDEVFAEEGEWPAAS